MTTTRQSGSFAHLHVHTEYSMLDGASRLDDVVQAAARDGQPGLGITDHGNMYGVLDFYRACRAAGIKPVIGTEAYMALESRDERPARRGRVDDSGGDADGGRKLYYHLTLLAENDVGYKNLIQIASRSFLEGYYYKPRCDWDMLADHSEGLIVTTGCLGGQVLQALMQDDMVGARQKAGRLREIFGADNFFVELQDHGIPDQKKTNPQLLQIARDLSAPLLATNDSHYTHREDAAAHDALLCVQTNSQMSDPNRFKFSGTEHYLKSAAEMRELFSDSEVAGACDNTLLIVERANASIEFGVPQLPDFPVPDGFDGDRDYLQHLTMEGAKQRWGDPLPEAVTERLAYELTVINNMGFDSYFLITWDLIRHAREAGIRVGPGRGSAAGCAVSYALRITDLDPIRYGLLFERFLNPDRVSMPDIDMDFDSRYRDEMIRYAASRYGRDRVAQIVTFSQIKARAAVRDAARVLGYPYSAGDKIAKAMPPLIGGRDTPLKYCLERSPEYSEGYEAAAEVRQIVEADPDAKAIVEVATGLEGLRRQDSIHAAAVVITKDPLTDHLPIQRKAGPNDPEGAAPVVTQYEMHGVEALGLLKMDFLGLRNLDVISDCVDLVRQTTGAEIDIDNPPLDDAATYEMLQRGETIGVFQLESGPMRALVRALAPTTLDDIAALVALYRPGPMAHNIHNDYADRKNGRQAVEHIHPDAADVLADTYGLMIYQEDVMRMAQKFAGYSLAEADTLRKAMGKKIRSVMAEEREKFVAGVNASGYGKPLGAEMFGIIEKFADYAFNKSHSYGYGYIAYQTAYLKANYPVEYMAALLTSVKDNLKNAAVYLNECRLRGVEVTVPDINLAGSAFTPASNGSEERRIAFGLSAIRHVGEGLAARVIAEREANGRYESFADFLSRSDSETLNKRAIESMIKAGAFDGLGHPRQGLLNVYEQSVSMAVSKNKDRDNGVVSLFDDTPDSTNGAFDEMPDIPDMEMDRLLKMATEKDVLGLYISDHPLLGIDPAFSSKAEHTVAGLQDAKDGTRASLCGHVSGLRIKTTRKGDNMAVFTLEDMSGTVECLLFPRAFAKTTGLANDVVAWMSGRIENADQLKFFPSEIEIASMGAVSPAKRPLATRSLRINLPPGWSNAASVDAIKAIILEHPGQSRVTIRLDERSDLRLPASFGVDADTAAPALAALLGSEAVVPV